MGWKRGERKEGIKDEESYKRIMQEKNGSRKSWNVRR
jgi:hypothetical protein